MAKKGKNTGTGGTLFFLALGAGLIYLLRTGSAATQITWSIAKIKIVSIGVLEVRADLAIQVTNPSRFPLTFKDFFGQFYMNGAPIARVSAPDTAQIQPKSVSTLRIPLVISTPDILAQTVDFFRTRKAPPVTFRGSAVVNGIEFPLEQTLSLTA